VLPGGAAGVEDSSGLGRLERRRSPTLERDLRQVGVVFVRAGAVRPRVDGTLRDLATSSAALRGPRGHGPRLTAACTARCYQLGEHGWRGGPRSFRTSDASPSSATRFGGVAHRRGRVDDVDADAVDGRPNRWSVSVGRPPDDPADHAIDPRSRHRELCSLGLTFEPPLGRHARAWRQAVHVGARSRPRRAVLLAVLCARDLSPSRPRLGRVVVSVASRMERQLNLRAKHPRQRCGVAWPAPCSLRALGKVYAACAGELLPSLRPHLRAGAWPGSRRFRRSPYSMGRRR